MQLTFRHIGCGAATILAGLVALNLYSGYARMMCTQNVSGHGIGRAINAYKMATGLFPERLDQLVPQYLPKLPRCPAAWSDTYGPGYEMHRTERNMLFDLYCPSNNCVGTACDGNRGQAEDYVIEYLKRFGEAPPDLAGVRDPVLRACPNRGTAYVYEPKPNSWYTLTCTGSHHGRPGLPQYSSYLSRTFHP